MAIPDFQSAMKPVLECLSKMGETNTSSIRDCVAGVFHTTEEERSELLPSGKARIYDNRIAWAITYLKMAGLIESTKRSYYQVTDSGSAYLKENPPAIDIKALEQFEEFRKKREGSKQAEEVEEQITNIRTPEELIESGYRTIHTELAGEILDKMKTCNPYFFEKIVVDLLLSMGYGGSRSDHGTITRKSGDEGIDGIIKEDKLGLDLIYVQAKRWESPVGSQEIQKFAGALQGQRAKKGIFITTSRFSLSADEYVNKIDSRIILIDGIRLANLMIENNVGVSIKETYVLKRLDSDYFIED